jgi:hypothetical protein
MLPPYFVSLEPLTQVAVLTRSAGLLLGFVVVLLLIDVLNLSAHIKRLRQRTQALEERISQLEQSRRGPT